MAASFVIPSIFTAVDQLSPTVKAMGRNVHNFAQASEAAFARTDRVIRRLTPGLGTVQKQLLSMVGTGAALAGGFQLGRFSFNSLVEAESAIDSFRVIVSDLSDTDFQKFQSQMMRVSKDAKRSIVDVAQSFEKIAGLNSSFAETAEGIGQVSEAAITMAKAARMDLGTAAENLVGIMNQFSFSADKANRTINVLAAGQAVGAASITQTAEAFTVFGSIAAGANITLEQSVGLIQTLGKFSLFGAEAGTKLRGSILRLQKAGIGYASGQFNVNDALNQTNTILSKLQTQKQKDMVINKLFGAENVTAGRILLSNVDTIQKFTREVSNTSEAQKAAAINSGNLRTVLQELSARWVNMLSESGKAGSVMNTISNAAQWLTNNLETVVDAVVTGVKWFAIIKGAMWAWQAAIVGVKVASTALSAVSTAFYLIDMVRYVAVTNGITGSTAAWKIAQTSLNAAMAANPIGITIMAVAALAAGVGYLLYHEKELNDEYERQQNLNIKAHIDAQTQATKKLADQWEAVGFNTKDAIVKALQYQVLKASEGLGTAKSKQAEVEGRLVDATNESWFPAFSAEVQRLRNELDQTKAQVTLALSDQRGATTAVDNAMKGGIIDIVEGRNILQGKPVKIDGPKAAPQMQQKTFSAEQQALIDEMNATIKASVNATITIENKSDSEVGLKSGKTNMISVMPKTQSTKMLQAAYDR